MSDADDKGLLAKAWDSLLKKGPTGLGRDVRDYARWRLNTPREAAAAPAPLPLSNVDLNLQEIQQLPETLQSKPILVYAEATTRCNLQCFMCRLSFPETTRQVREHMRLETFSKIEPLLEPGSRLSLFGLGEPLLNPNFVDMLRIAKERGAFVGLNSNAMLLTERIAKAMVELEQDLLVISFSGGTRETYERVHTGSNYDRVLAQLRRLNELKTEALSNRQSAVGEQESESSTQHPAPSTSIVRVKPVLQLQFTAMRDNIEELPQAVKLAIELRCAGLVAMPLTLVDSSIVDQSLLNPALRGQIETAFAEARDVAATADYPFDLQLPTGNQLLGAGPHPDPLPEGEGDPQHSAPLVPAPRTQNSEPRTAIAPSTQ
ncbi:MAG TPA: radical SAM protein, partial [Chloroflexota bacterium]|nr:radical SAM protein [Chloroflexota bacterium]